MKSPSLGDVISATGVIIEDPVFRTGSDSWDTWLTFGLYTLLLISVIRVTMTFFHQCQLRRHDVDTTTWKWIRAFLALSIVSLLVVNFLRYKHREIKLGSLETIRQARKAGGVLQRNEIKDRVPDGVDLKYKAYKYFYGKLPDALVEKSPWLPLDWSRNASVWDYFKLLIDSPRRNWWTQQWAVGYLFWAIFVTRECQVIFEIFRPWWLFHLSYWDAASVWLRCRACSMLCFCCCLDRRLVSNSRFYVDIVAVLVLAQITTYVGLPWALKHLEQSPVSARPMREIIFGALQATLLALPVLTPLLSRISRSTLEDQWHQDRRVRGKVTAFTCSAAGLLSTVLHLYSSYRAFVEANPGRFSQWAQLTYFSPWRHEHNSLKSTAFYILGTLGDHPWINALAWDVLFSILSLCAYSAASRSDTRGMLQCSIAPWLDDFIEAAKQVFGLPKDGIEWAVAQDAARKATKQLSIGQQYMKDYYKTSPEGWKVYKKKMLPEDFEDSGEANEHSDEASSEAVRNTRALRPQTRLAADAAQSARRSTKRSGDKGREVQASSACASRKASGSRSAPRPKSARAESRKKAAEEDREHQNSSVISTDGDDNFEGRAEQMGVAWCLYVVGGLGLAPAAVYGADVLP
ncbi:hypothetical protein AC579_1478 [Pseudocercospora musae]|uniref:Uncharacterized protein n=1 Tax=Pseudocercospora musae TaxID=113226 RepID=A0A139I2D1_9PEZI|nr:hypothetical protein AC579_1478 [Pseudocercospora musae]